MGVKTRNLGNSEGKDIQWQAALSRQAYNF